MIDKTYLEALLPILRANNVKSIKMHGVELHFHNAESSNGRTSGFGPENVGSTPTSAANADDQSVENIAEVLKKQEEALPPDLRADSLMDQDKILNWSSPDQKPFEEDIPLPLTGEEPL